MALPEGFRVDCVRTPAGERTLPSSVCLVFSDVADSGNLFGQLEGLATVIEAGWEGQRILSRGTRKNLACCGNVLPRAVKVQKANKTTMLKEEIGLFCSLQGKFGNQIPVHQMQLIAVL